MGPARFGVGFTARDAESTLAEKLARSFKVIFALIFVTLAITVVSFWAMAGSLDPRIQRHLEARAAIEHSHAGMLDQVIGIRGYMLTGSPQFLEPYRMGSVQTDRHMRRLHALLDQDPSLSNLVLVTEERQGEWREWARRALGGGIPDPRRLDHLAEGKALFDDYRLANAALTTGLERTLARSRSLGVTVQRGTAALGLLACLVSLGFAVRQHRRLRAAVVAPVDRLVATIGQIGRGELDQSVEVEGPLELVRIGEGLNEMSRALRRERRTGEARQCELERKNTFVELLGAITAAANEALTVEEAFSFTVGRVAAHTGWPVGHAYIREQGGRFQSMEVWHLEDPERFGSFKKATQDESFDITRGLGRDVLRTGRAQSVTRFPTIASFRRNRVAGEAGLMSALAFPVVLHREVLGILEFFSTEEQEPDTELLAVMESVGVQLGQVLERAEHRSQLEDANQKLNAWVDELEDRNRETSTLNEMSDLLQSCETSDEAHAVVADAGSKLFVRGNGCLYVRNASRNLLEPVATWGGPTFHPQPFAPDECWALRRGRNHVIAHDTGGVACKHSTARTGEDLACLPLAAQGEVLGMMHLRFPPTSEGSLGELDRRQLVAVGFAERVALAVANFKLRETLRNQSIRDPLTDLFNRRYAQETLEREIHRANRSGVPLSVVMADIDHFKAFNDRYGHDVGDKVLTTVSDTLKRSIRSEDVACRYGGEEFMLVMLEASAEDARVRAEGIRRKVEDLELAHEGRSLGPLTLSLGVGVFPDHGLEWEAVVAVADAALYKAKHGGRNRVEVSATQPAPAPVGVTG